MPTKKAPAKKAAPARKAATKPLTPWQAWCAKPDSLDSLCAQIEGGTTLTAFAAALGVPTSTLTRWLDADAQRSARARDARTRAAEAWDHMALQGIEKAADPFELARAKEMAHHLRWRAKVVNPREYGDKVALGGDADAPPIQTAATVTIDPSEAYLKMIGKSDPANLQRSIGRVPEIAGRDNG